MYMLTSSNLKTITDMRENAVKLLTQARKSSNPLYILHRSKPQAVLLSLTQYNKLREMAEDHMDSLRAQDYEEVGKRKVKWISHKDVLKKLKVK
jgi:PHD/YefM family antitoxin component YafN of YafNO toxin-antitoxin module